MIFQQKYFYYILLTDQIYFSDCLYFLIFWAICLLQFSFPGCDIINFENNLIFVIKSFLYKTKKSRQKFKHFENKESF